MFILNFEICIGPWFFFSRFATRRVMLLEFSQYLENYLWPNYHSDKVLNQLLQISLDQLLMPSNELLLVLIYSFGYKVWCEIALISLIHIFYSAFQVSREHILSIVAMVNEKFRERVPAWEVCPNVTLTLFPVFCILTDLWHELGHLWSWPCCL